MGPKVLIEGRRIFGKTVQNYRGPMAAFMIGVNAIKNAGIRLKGDVLMTAVLGEIGKAPIDVSGSPREISPDACLKAKTYGAPVEYGSSAARSIGRDKIPYA